MRVFDFRFLVLALAAVLAPALAHPAMSQAPPADGTGEQRLLDAARAGDRATVEALLARGVDADAREVDGTTALHWAVHRNDGAVVDRLLAAGARVTAVNRYGVPPLWLACENGSAAMIARLLAAGADPNTTVADGETVLMTAARTGAPEAVRVLLDQGATVGARETWRGQTALMWAAVEGNSAAVSLLLDSGADLHARSAFATTEGRQIGQGAAGEGGFTALLFAVRGGHLDTTRTLLARGANVDDALPGGMSALVVAVVNAHYELAALLLEEGADPNAAEQGWTALHQLVWTRRPNRGFAQPGPVLTGALDGLHLVDRLVSHGADVNARQVRAPRDGYRTQLDRTGATPFLLAAKSADVELMRGLLANGADPRLTTADRTTPLMVAAGVGIYNVGESPGTNAEALEAVRLAWALGGDVVAVNDYGYTALHGAAHRGAPEIVTFLADRGARLQARLTKSGNGASGWQEGWTPLTIADGVFYSGSFKRSLEVAALLRELMAARGLTPPLVAAGRGVERHP